MVFHPPDTGGSRPFGEGPQEKPAAAQQVGAEADAGCSPCTEPCQRVQHCLLTLVGHALQERFSCRACSWERLSLRLGSSVTHLQAELKGVRGVGKDGV